MSNTDGFGTVQKEQIGDSLKSLWDDPSYREKMLAERASRWQSISVDGVVYSSLDEASKTLGVAKSALFGRLKSKHNTTVVKITADHTEIDNAK